MSEWMQLSYFTAIALIIIIFGTAAVVLWLIFTGKIDLSSVLEEPGSGVEVPGSGKASLSRFQFLLFTFVIAGLFLTLSIEAGAFVNIPDGVLMLMGISAGSYAVSKGITNAKK